MRYIKSWLWSELSCHLQCSRKNTGYFDYIWCFSSDCLAFETCNLHKQLENGLLTLDLVLFGDNACMNSNLMATLGPNVAGMDKDRSKGNYNFYHSQVITH